MKILAFRQFQRGFTLVEIGVVAIILVVLIAIVVPRIQDEIISSRVPSVGKDLITAITRLQQIAVVSNSSTPFSVLPALENLFSGSNLVFSGASLLHGLGDPTGRVEVDSLLSGAAVVITLWGIDPAACPALALTLSKSVAAVEISMSGTASAPTAPTPPAAPPIVLSATVVKVATTAFDAGLARSACNSTGQHNFMRFFIFV